MPKNPIVLRSQADADKVMGGQWVVYQDSKPWQWFGQPAFVNWTSPAKPEPNTVTVASPGLRSVLGICVVLAAAATLFFQLRPKRKPAREPNPPKKKGVIYTDYEQFQSALKIHRLKEQAFEHDETARLEALEKSIKDNTPTGHFALLCVIIGACYIGYSPRSWSGMGHFPRRVPYRCGNRFGRSVMPPSVPRSPSRAQNL